MRRLRIITARPLLGIELAIEHPRNVQNFDNQRCPDNAADQQAVNQWALLQIVGGDKLIIPFC